MERNTGTYLGDTAASGSNTLKNGIHADTDGEIRYYVDGVTVYAGLIYVDGYYYYIRSSGVAARNTEYFVSKHNDLLPERTYTFDANGRMVNTPDAPFVESDFQYNADGLRISKTVSVASSAAPKDGLYRDADGEIRYYDNGFASYAGLILVNGSYYYIRSNYVAARNCSYAISVNNGLLPLGTYTFDADGKMVNPPTGSAVGTVVNANGTKDTNVTIGYTVANTVTTKYHYVGDTLAGLTQGSNKLYFVYDVLGPSAVIYNGTTYYYTRNAQGDITGIVNSSGSSKVVYTYDAWGNPLTTTGELANTLGALNPLRYRGYVYDSDSNLYYLQSRYYSSAWGRFINPDTTDVLTVSSGNATWDKNLFAYCDNNPVSRKDSGGRWWNFAVGIVAGACIGGASQIISNIIADKKWSAGLGVAIGAGAVSGFIAASSAGLVGSIIKNAATSMAGNAVRQVLKNDGLRNFDVGDMIIDGVIGGVAGAVGGSGMGKAVNIRTLNTQLTNKIRSRSAQVAKQGIKYYVSQTGTLYKNFLLKPMSKSGLTSTIALSIKGLFFK